MPKLPSPAGFLDGREKIKKVELVDLDQLRGPLAIRTDLDVCREDEALAVNLRGWQRAYWVRISPFRHTGCPFYT